MPTWTQVMEFVRRLGRQSSAVIPYYKLTGSDLDLPEQSELPLE
jgi:hypothetical protein